MVMPGCLSSSCSHDEKSDCTATVTGNTIENGTKTYDLPATNCTESVTVTFEGELTADDRFHRYFLTLAEAADREDR